MVFWRMKRWLLGSMERQMAPLGDTHHEDFSSKPERISSPSWTSTRDTERGLTARLNIRNFLGSIGQQVVSQFQSAMVDSRAVVDATIGLTDGLTVPFALTAGLSALGSPQVVVYGGLAELLAGSISMGLGGYLGGIHEAYV
jgi:hypothetical protein